MWIGLGLRRRLAGGRQSFLQLANLVIEIGKRARRSLVFEVHRRRSALHLARVQECGKRVGDVVEDAFASLLPDLDLIPALTHASRRPP